MNYAMKMSRVGWILLLAGVAAPAKADPPSADYRLIWSDEFDGAALDETKWRYRPDGPRKAGFNKKSAVTVDGNGHLVITISKSDEQYVGGMITTEGRYETTYGYFESRVRLPQSRGWWPAFWLQSVRVSDPELGRAPANDTRACGAEIDIFEYLSGSPDKVCHNLHWNGYGKLHETVGKTATVAGLSEGFHTFGVDWRRDGYTFFVDGQATWQTAAAVSGAKEYIILSGEVHKLKDGIASATLPDSVLFDYVRVYQIPPTP